MTLRRLVLVAVLAAAVLVGATACGDDGSSLSADGDPTGSTPPDTTVPQPTTIPGEGDTAVWSIDASAPVADTDESFVAQVSRLGCSGGETGEVLAPEVAIGDAEIVVEFTVAPLDPDTAYECPSNDLVPYEVDLGEPIGDRALVDGACAGEAGSTSFCADGGVRRPAG